MSEASDRVARRALELFAERGYDAVSMRDLGDALGMQAPSIYSHFPSKESLLLAVLAPLMEGLYDVLGRAPAAPVTDGQRRSWLADLVHVMLAERLASRIATYDQAVTWHPVLVDRMRDVQGRLVAVLGTFGVTDPILATAVIGGIAAPLHVDTLPADYTEATAVNEADLLITTAARRS